MASHTQLEPGTHVLKVNGIEQYYHVFGYGPVCVVHPGGPGAHWAYMRVPDLEASMTMVYLEPIGTGASGRLPEHPAGYTISRYSQQLDGFLTALNLDQIFLLGQSHGGFVAQEYAHAHPERLAGLILCNTSAVTGPEFMQAADATVRRRAAGYSDSVQAAEVLRAWESVPRITDDASYTSAMRGLLPIYFADPHNTAIPTVRAALVFYYVVGDSTPFDVRSDLPSLKVPALIIVGSDDFICGPRWADTIQACLPSAERVDFDQCGHLVHVERPTEFAEAVTRFVAQVRSG
jgi:pimeloyl-ACP methyl ester carboxylesterase